MNVKRVFISFDYDHDNDLRGNLVAQAKNPESPFSIEDWSVQHQIDENWRWEVRERIRRSDLTIVICGEHTHDAPGVAAEVTIAREERKPHFLLKGRRRKTCTKPAMTLSADEMHKWTWKNLTRLIAEAR
ncbi:MAG: TIR domain-containing protein [Chloroflexi bacterium]|nr:TIR domain-containing protein [Chloroflexota bacterium]